MGTMSFLVNDQSTELSGQPVVRVTLEETGDGRIAMRVGIEGPIVGDLRGLFFDLADESLIGSLAASAVSGLTEFQQGNDSVRDLGEGANMNGLLGSDRGYDAGAEIGSAGIGKDDVRSFSFVLSSSARALGLADFAQVDFGVRSTSVGTAGSARSASSKLLETSFRAMDAQDDSDGVNENQTHTGSLLANDRSGLPPTDSLSVTAWSGGALGHAVLLANTEGASLTVNADGSYTLDASLSDALSAGELFTFTFTYNARHDHNGSDWSTDSAFFTVVVQGVNDGPQAGDDDAGTIQEGASASGHVLANDHDIDRLDHLYVTGVLDQDGFYTLGTVLLASGASVTIAADGSYTYDAGSAFDDLVAGQHADDSFVYQISDGQGGFDTATVTMRIEGLGPASSPGDAQGTGGATGEADPPPPPDLFPTMRQALSNVVLYLDDGNAATDLIKVKISPDDGLTVHDVDDLQLAQFLGSHAGVLAGNTTLVAISIHAGQEYPNVAGLDGTRNGEGVFFLMDDATPIAPVGMQSPDGGWTQSWGVDDYPLQPEALALGLSAALLGAAASQTFIFDGGW